MVRAHAIYLAVIAALIILVVYLAVRSYRASVQIREIETRYNIRDLTRAATPRSAPLRQLSTPALMKPRTYAEHRDDVDKMIACAVQQGEFGPTENTLGRACVAALSGGKRIRAVFLLEIARAVNVNRARPDSFGSVDAVESALFVEFMHSASLVVDDMPAFDDDAERRGRPSVSAAFGPAVAQMASVTLFAAAVQNMCRQVDWIRDNRAGFGNADRLGTMLCGEMARAVRATADGQHMDMLNSETLSREYGTTSGAASSIAAKKTAPLFELAAATGWLVAGGSVARLSEACLAGKYLGTAFQNADDLSDVRRDAERKATGKPGWNLANEIGVEAATAELARNLAAGRLYAERCGFWTPCMRELFALIDAQKTVPT